MSSIRERATAALKRTEAVSKGPWRECGADRGGCVCGQVWSDAGGDDVLVFIRGNDPEDEGVPLTTLDEGMANARFAAHARDDVPDLAEWILRITGPEMRERVHSVVAEHIDECTVRRDIANAIITLLCEGTP